MLGLACNYTPEQHKLLDTGILQWCKRQCSDRDLRNKIFMYYHNREHTYVIALWVNQPKGAFVDVLNMGYSPANFDRGMAEGLQQRLFAPLTTTDVMKQVRDSHQDYLRQQQEQSEGEIERRRQRGLMV